MKKQRRENDLTGGMQPFNTLLSQENDDHNDDDDHHVDNLLLLDFYLLCVFKCDLRELRDPSKCNHTGFIYLIFPHCVFLNVSSNHPHAMMQNYTDCICFVYLQCVSSCVSSNRKHEMMHSHTGCICLAFFHCAF